MVTLSSVHSRTTASRFSLEPRYPIGLRRAKAVEFNFAVAKPGTKHDAAIRHGIDGRELLGNIERLMER